MEAETPESAYCFFILHKHYMLLLKSVYINKSILQSKFMSYLFDQKLL